jgi:hypothetical protein
MRAFGGPAGLLVTWKRYRDELLAECPSERAFVARRLIAVEDCCSKVRLYTPDELWPWISHEVDIGRSLGRPEGEIRVNIVSRYGDAGLRLYLRTVAER